MPANDLHSDPASERVALHRLAEALCRASGTPVDQDTAHAAADAALLRNPDPEVAGGRLDDLAVGLGLRAARWRGTAATACGEARPGRPVVVWDGRRWWIAEGGRRCRLRAVDGARVARPTGEIDGFTVVPELPGSVLGGGLTPRRRLLALARAEREDVGLVIVFALASGILGLATPVVVQVFVNTVAFGAFRQPLVALAALLLVCLGAAAGLRLLQRVAIETLERRLFVRMAADLAARLPRLRAEVGREHDVRELVNRFFDVVTVQKAVSSLMLDGLSAALQAVVGLGLLAVYHPALLGFDAMLLLLILGVLIGGLRRGEATAILESKKKYAVAAWLEAVAADPDTFRHGAGPDLAVARADKLARTWLRAREDHFRVVLAQVGGSLGLQVFASVALLSVGGWLVLDGQLTLGQLVAAELVVGQALVGSAKIAEKLDTVYDLLAAVDKLGRLVDLPLERGGGVLPPSEGPAQVSVDGLRLGEAVVRLDLPAGEATAVVIDEHDRHVLAAAIGGLDAAAASTVSLDGVRLDDLRLDAVRRDVALLRHAAVFRGTLADNVGLDAIGVDLPAVRAVAGLVGLDGALARLPDGPATPLGPNGQPLDDVDRVRVAVARAVLARPRLLLVDGLLDGLTSADRSALLDVIAAPDAPWTLLLLTADPTLAARCAHAWRVGPGGVSPLPTAVR